MTGNLFSVINSASLWNSHFSLSSNVAILNGISIWSDGNKPSKIVYSDALGDLASIPDFFNPVRAVSVHFPRIGVTITTGYVPRFT